MSPSCVECPDRTPEREHSEGRRERVGGLRALGGAEAVHETDADRAGEDPTCDSERRDTGCNSTGHTACGGEEHRQSCSGLEKREQHECPCSGLVLCVDACGDPVHESRPHGGERDKVVEVGAPCVRGVCSNGRATRTIRPAHGVRDHRRTELASGAWVVHRSAAFVSSWGHSP